MNNYNFLNYNHNIYNTEPLEFLIIKENLSFIRKAFQSLNQETKNVLNYFIIEGKRNDFIDIDLNYYLYILRKNYLKIKNGLSE